MSGPLRLLPVAASPLASDVARLQDILPWFAHDALIHYLAPRGLEQYSGGGWGTRDVCQGPRRAAARARPLRAGARPAAARLPQPEPGRRLAAVVHVLRARARASARATRTATSSSGRCSRSRSTCSRPTTRRSSTRRCRSSTRRATRAPSTPRSGSTSSARSRVIDARVIPGTRLAAYGHGDWNDSLQPADPAMRERLCSAWTVTLQLPDAAHAGRRAAPRSVAASARRRSRRSPRRCATSSSAS